MQLITLGISASLVGALVASVLPLVWRSMTGHRVAQVTLAAAAFSGTAAAVAFLVSGSGPLSVFNPAGIPALRLEINALSAVFFVIVSAVACLCAIFAYRYVEMYATVYPVQTLDAGVAFFVFGMLAVLLSTNVIGFMLFWEAMSLTSFALVMADRAEDSRKAALLYFVMAQLGAAAIMAGFLLVSGGTFAIGFADLALKAATLAPWQVTLAFTLFFIGFGSKAGLVPLHTWLPEAHPQAPSHVSALMSSAMLKIAVYGFLLVTATVFPSLGVGYGLAVIGVGLTTAVFGILHASVEHDLKRAIAWHSIENLGLIFGMIGISMFAGYHGLGLLSEVAMAAALFHCINHAIFKSGLFLSTGVIMSQMHTRDIEEMGGLTKRMPYFTVAICALTLSGAALPPFGTFFDEWMFIQGLIGSLAGATPWTQAVLLLALAVTAFCGGLAVFAMTKLFALPCLGQPRSVAAAATYEPAPSMNAPVLFFAAAALLSGVFASWIIKTIGGSAVLEGNEVTSAITAPGGLVTPMVVFVLLAVVVAVLVAARYLFGNKRVRYYQTWDCGQPITSRMEYTATAFSAPIRFFFRLFVSVRKVITSEPSESPLVVKRHMELAGQSFWIVYLHDPVSRGFNRVGELLRRVQSGSIQQYLLYIFVTLIVTLTIAL